MPKVDAATIAGEEARKWKQTPKAKTAREESRTAHMDAGSAEARSLLQSRFEKLLAGLDQDVSRAIEPEAIEQFISSTVARVDVPGEKRNRVVVSTVPLRDEEDGAPVDLDLERNGEFFEPQNPLVDVALPVDLGDPVRLEEAEVGIELKGADAPGTKAIRLDSDELFYHEVALDTDALLSPVSEGAELFTQIRSAQAPEQLLFKVHLPADAELRDAGVDGLEVARDGERLALIRTPWAVDADGIEVDARVAIVDKDRFELVVEHQDRDLAYPLLVDPTYENWYHGGNNWLLNWGATGGLDQWSLNGWSPGNQFYASTTYWNVGWGTGRGLYLYAFHGWWYPAGAWGQWEYTAPGATTFIPGATFGPVYYSPGQGGCCYTPYIFFGLHGAGGWSDYETQSAATNAAGNWYEMGGSNNTKQAIFGMYSNPGSAPGGLRAAALGGAFIWLDDPEPPTTSIVTPPSSSWASDRNESVVVKGQDPGLGVQTLRLYVPDVDDPTGSLKVDHGATCGGSRQSGICPPAYESSVSYGTEKMPEGRNEVLAVAVDATDWEAQEPAKFDVRVDRSPPKLKLSGTLASAPAGALKSGSYSLSVEARDGSAEDRSTERSGVESITVLVDGAEHAKQEWTCPEGNCKQELQAPPLDASVLTPGSHLVEIRANDRAGNEAIRKLDLTVAGIAGVLTAPEGGDKTFRRLPLEAERRDPQFTGATFEYRRPGVGDWQPVPLGQLKLPDGEIPSAYPIALDGEGRTPRLMWDLQSTPGLGGADGPVKVRARFSGAGGPQEIEGDDPSLYWRLGEAEGAVAGDSSGNGREGTYLGEPAPSLNVAGAPALPQDDDGAVDLNGSTNFISSSYEPFANGSARTFAGWAKRDTESSYDVLIGGKSSGDSAPYLALGGEGGTPPDEVQWWPGAGDVVSWETAWPGSAQWVHWALVVDEQSDTAELFINGQSSGVRPAPAPYPASPGPLFAGAKWVNGGAQHNFDGQLDELAVFERALTATELQTHMNGLHRGLSQVVPVTLDRDSTTSKHASTQIGPGSLDLLTGNFSVGADDVTIASYGSDLTVSRTHASREPGKEPNGPFGPGWIASVPIDAAGSDYVRLSEAGPPENPSSVIKIMASDSTEILFSKKGAEWEVEPLYTGLSLSRSGAGYALKDLDGNVTSFVKPAGAQQFVPVSVRQTGNGAQTTSRLIYETVGGVTRVKAALAPEPAGVSCLSSTDELALVRGCRALEFTYSPEGTPPPTGTSLGPYPGRLQKIAFRAWNTAVWPAAMASIDVARYDYDSGGRLRAAWDPRISPALKTTYAYDAAGRISEVKPPGENAWTMSYQSASGDPNEGRLRSVARANPSGGTATTTAVYDVPVTGSGAPRQMGAGDVDDWAQTDVPTDATAVFPADAPPSGDPPSSYSAAAVHYLNRNGDLVNLAAPGGAISTTEYDDNRQVRRELTPGNRARALASSDPAAASRRLDTQRTYNADGTELLEEFGPEHEIMLSNGDVASARQHTVLTYDEGAPQGGEFHLPTTQTVGARVSGQSTDVDLRTTKTDYAWNLRQPTAVTIDPDGLNLTTKTSYDSGTGLPIERRLPKANAAGTDAHTTKTVYYTAGDHPTVLACGNQPDLANLACKESPGGEPGGSAPKLLSTTYGYNIWNQVQSTFEQRTDGVWGAYRGASKTYDAAGRETSTWLFASGGAAVPNGNTTYSPTTGRVTATSATDGSVTRTISRGYDAIGRQTSYTDADGVTSTTSYDILDRPVQAHDGKGSTTFNYDPLTGRPTAIAVEGVGSFAAGYDVDGNVVSEVLPNGQRVDSAYNEVGAATGRTYLRQDCATDCAVLDFAAHSTIHGQVKTDVSTLGVRSYSYDPAGRLTAAFDDAAGSCVGHRYNYDADSNRTASRTVAALPNGDCDTAGAGTGPSHTYDAADRLIDPGYTYDDFGRTLTVPASGAGGQQLSATYYADDRVRTLTQGGTTHTFSMDPANRVRVRATSGLPNEIHHYSDDSDAPAWIARGAAWSRFTGSIGGSLSAIQEGSGTTTNGVSFQLTNLHGDVVAQTDAQGNLGQTFSADEFGVPQGPLPASGYGWLGGKERRSQFASGVITMGQRVYVPQLGRFLQTDPIVGGSANDYDYVNQDPQNTFDLEGTCAICKPVKPIGKVFKKVRNAAWNFGKGGRVKVGGRFGRRVLGNARRGIKAIVRAGGLVVAGIKVFVTRVLQWAKHRVRQCMAGASTAWAQAGTGYVPLTARIVVGAVGCLGAVF